MSATLDTSGKPARTVLLDLLRPHLHKRWVLLDDDRPGTDSDRPRVRVAQQAIAPGKSGDRRIHLVTFRVTITVPGDSVAAAEALLDDELEAVLHAFDKERIPWTKADKAQFTDEGNRIGYSFELELFTNPHANSE